MSIRRGWEEAAPSCREGFALHLKEVADQDRLSASRRILGRGRLALLHESRKDLESELLERAMAAFSLFRNPGTEWVEIANRSPLFLLSRRRGRSFSSFFLPPCSGSPPGLR